MACDFQQFDILTSVDSDEPLQPPFKLINSKWCSVSSLTIIDAYAQADLRLCWSHVPHCWKFHALAHFLFLDNIEKIQEKFKLSFDTFENIMENEAFAPKEQMLHFP